jgi:DNA-binding MarR family transcriptional regulator
MIDFQLSIWMSILVLYIRTEQPDLSNVQTALLLIIYMTPGPHSARDLALQLRAPKSSVSRGLNRLAMLGFVRQERDPGDLRKSIISQTHEGMVFLEALKKSIEVNVRNPANDAEKDAERA